MNLPNNGNLETATENNGLAYHSPIIDDVSKVHFKKDIKKEAKVIQKNEESIQNLPFVALKNEEDANKESIKEPPAALEQPKRDNNRTWRTLNDFNTSNRRTEKSSTNE